MVHGTLNILLPCSPQLLWSLTDTILSFYWLLKFFLAQVTQSSFSPNTWNITPGKTSFFSHPFFILNFLLIIPNAVTTSPVIWVLTTGNYKIYIFTRKNSTYTKCWQSSVALFCTVCFYLVLNSSLYYLPRWTSPSFHPEWRSPNPVDCTFKCSLCSCSFYPFHALTLSPACTPSVKSGLL